MGVFHGYETNLPTQLWIAARYMESLSLFLAPLFFGRKLKANLIFLGYTLVTSILLLFIFYWNIFPVCFVEGVGLTPFKKISEYIISLILLGSIVLLLKNRKEFERNVLQWVVWSILLSIVSELAFTFYIDAYGLSNLIGHFFKILSFYFIYKAIIETGLTKPYDLLFRNLKRREETLQRERDRARKYLDIAGVILVVIDSDRRVSLINKQGCVVLGYKEEEIIGKTWFDHFIPEAERDKVKAGLSKLITGDIQEFEYFEYPILTKSGEERVIAWHNTLLKDEMDNVIATLSSGEDITERKKAEEALRESQALFQKLAQVSPVGIFRTDAEGNCIYVNKRWQEIAGMSMAQAIGFGWSSAIHPEDRDHVTAEWYASAQRKTPFLLEYRFQRPEGVTTWVIGQATAETDSNGHVTGYVGTITDITKHRQAEAALRKIEWLLTKSSRQTSLPNKLKGSYQQPYGNLVELNTTRILTEWVGEDVLIDIAGDFLDLLETSAAVYEKNGDYALGIFTSGWCRYLDQASRNLSSRHNNREALESSKWHCHESCWSEASKVCIKTGQPVDIECRGGIRIFAVPIWAGGEIVGSINFGYGDPPKHLNKLQEISERYGVNINKLLELAEAYESRPFFIIDIAKNRLLTSAKLVGTIYQHKQAEEALKKARDELEFRVQERTSELAKVNEELRKEIAERWQTEIALKESETKYRIVAENTYDWEWWINPEGNFVYVSPSCKRITHHDPEEFIKDSDLLLRNIHPDDQSSFIRHRNEIEQGDFPGELEFRIVRPDGSYLWITHVCQPVFDKEGHFLGRRGNNRDITERKQIEESLRESENRLRSLSSQLLTVQENERKRVAREIHDSIGQSLTAIKFRVENVIEQMGKNRVKKMEKPLEDLIPIVQEAVEETRRIQMDLRPSILDDLGILATVRWFCREFQTTFPSVRIETQMDIQEDGVSASLKTVIFRVMQEAFNNIAKHSKADLIRLSLRKTDGKIELIIEDNGMGFNLEGLISMESSKRGFGLSSMRERTELSGGAFVIESTPGKGTIIRASWPT
jgi:PAS domain S-box-containing protein